MSPDDGNTPPVTGKPVCVLAIIAAPYLAALAVVAWLCLR